MTPDQVIAELWKECQTRDQRRVAGAIEKTYITTGMLPEQAIKNLLSIIRKKTRYVKV